MERKQSENEKKVKKRERIFLNISLKYWYWFVFGMVAAYVLIGVTVKGTDMISKAIDQMIGGTRVDILKLLPALGLIIVIGTIASFVRTYFTGKFSICIQKDFKVKAIDKLVKLEYRYFDEEGSGGIITKLISDIQQAQTFFAFTIPEFFTSVITIVTVLVYIILLNFKLAAAILLCYPVVFIFSDYIGKILEKMAKSRRGKVDVMTEIANDSMAGIVVVRSYNLFEEMRNRLNKSIDAIMTNEYSRARINQISYIFQNVIFWIPNIICPTVALFMIYKGELTIGEMTSYVVLMNRIIGNMREMPYILNEGREVLVSIERLEDIINSTEESSGTFTVKDISSDSNYKENDYTENNYTQNDYKENDYIENDLTKTGSTRTDKDRINNIIEVEDITFSYDGNGDRNIFEDMSFSIEKGKTTAIVGGSGEGKTTIFKILCGFYSQQAGKYRLYGVDFEQWDIHEARGQFALVSQSVFLFPGTIAENVAYGKKGATFEEIVNACKMANIHEFIEKLPLGYETTTGERGVKLSGGECQRVSIARAILKNAPILLMDEPTSSVDVGTERLIQEAINNVSKERTVVIIAHRLSTIQNADRILVFHKGKLAETGSHDDLLKQNGKYADLYNNELSTKMDDEKIVDEEIDCFESDACLSKEALKDEK
ncbi:ABC transporter ATP-binding protein [[Clostridium] fimetarium]|uniref:ATP-binding cassette, subfamily B, MsbA n=1 Tax=[Clostridium] fimetarium TaxID=99656 RepID=A0A1I0QZ71_9FIRM|nr:ABC transporter ATP-binding protein [[Clostridium] fimetarium]SEW33249.1 ATP-binding cassette, subfamily B, MsbA [[Clostridium] fimetarium]